MTGRCGITRVRSDEEDNKYVPINTSCGGFSRLVAGSAGSAGSCSWEHRGQLGPIDGQH